MLNQGLITGFSGEVTQENGFREERDGRSGRRKEGEEQN